MKRNRFGIGIALVLVGGLFALSACTTTRITGTGRNVTEVREVSGFDEIELETFGDVKVIQGNETRLVVEADEALMPYVETYVQGGTLHLDVGRNNRSIWVNNADLSFELTVPDLSAVNISGSGNFDIESLETDRFAINIGGSGNIDLGDLEVDQFEINIGGSGDISVDDLTAEDIATNIGGSGDIRLAGRVSEQEIRVGGSGNYQAKDLESERVDIQVGGSGDATVTVSEQLDVDIDGSGNVEYYGSPSVDQSINGSGDVRSRGGR